MVGNVKSAFLKDQVIVVSTCGRSIPFWLLRNLCLDHKLDDSQAAFVPFHPILHLSTSMDYITDWLNPHSLLTMSAFGCTENCVYKIQLV